mmetsp:Transcript_5036/g.7481  ORF Transcript_5036/g.7481 Transcript_5036/m.7481 type:complete len:1127 (+) Transcript_5036:169-3549(+)
MQYISNKLAFSDEKDLLEYIPKPNYKKLPLNLQITILDRWKQFTKKYSLGSLIELVHCTVTIGFFILYIISLYDAVDREKHVEIIIIDLALTVIYVFFLFFELLMEDRKLLFLVKPHVVLDLFTILPVAVVLIVDIVLYFINPSRYFFVPGSISGGDPVIIQNHPWLENYPFYERGYEFIVYFPPFAVLRLFRLGSVLKTVYSGENRGVFSTIYVLFTTIFTLIVVFSSTILVFENEIYHREKPLEALLFHDAAYMVFITITTIGYGIVTPSSPPGKFAICLFFVIGLLVLVGQVNHFVTILKSKGNELLEILGLHSFYKHIIVSGTGTDIEILEFVKEFLNESHGKSEIFRIVVIMEDEKVLAKLRKSVSHRFFKERITILQGDISDFSVLELMAAEKSAGVFLMTDTTASDFAKQDKKSLLNVLAIKNYNEDIDIYVQYMLPTNKSAFSNAGCTVSICIQQMKVNILSNNLMVPGLSTLITNVLISTSAEEVIEEYEKQKNKKKSFWKRLRGNVDEEEEESLDDWVIEYCQGCENELYCVSFSPAFTGISFFTIVRYVYINYNVYLIGVNNLKHGVLLAPGTNENPYKIQPGDKAIVFAQSVFHAHVLSICPVPSHKLKDDIQIPNTDQDQELEGDKEPKVESATDSTGGDRSPHLTQLSSRSQKVNSFLMGRNLQKKRSRKFSKSSRHSQRTVIEEPSIIDESEKLQCASKPREKKDIILDIAKNKLSKHLVIIGDVRSAIYVLKNLRSHLLDSTSLMPILIFASHDMTAPAVNHLVDQIKQFDGVYVMFGEACNEPDIIRAGLFQASAALLLTPPGVDNDPSMVDADSIQVFLTLQSLIPTLPIVTEIVYRRNIKYFQKRIPSEVELNHKLSKIDKIFDLKGVDQQFEAYCLTSEQFASGKVFSRSFFSRLLGQLYFTPEIVDIVNAFNPYNYEYQIDKKKNNRFEFGSSNSLDDKDSVGNRKFMYEETGAHLVPVLEMFVDVEFHEVFRYYLRKRGIVIGIYRHTEHEGFSYVSCNPDRDVILREHDKLYVIGNKKQIMGGEINWEKPLKKTTLKEIATHYANPLKSMVENDSETDTDSDYDMISNAALIPQAVILDSDSDEVAIVGSPNQAAELPHTVNT